MVRYCSVNLCLSSSCHEGRKFHTFPTDKYRCQQWILAAGRDDLLMKSVEILSKYYFICDLHFKESDRHKNRLKCNAVPSLNLTSPLTLTTDTKSTQTDTSTNDASCQVKLDGLRKQPTQIISVLPTDTPRKRKLKIQLEIAWRKRQQLELRKKQGTYSVVPK